MHARACLSLSLEYLNTFTGLVVVHSALNRTHTARIIKVNHTVSCIGGPVLCSLHPSPLNLVLIGQTLVTRQTEEPVVPLGGGGGGCLLTGRESEHMLRRRARDHC